MTNTYLAPSDSAAKRLFSLPSNKEMVMLNLLRFRDIADYSNFHEHNNSPIISGREAFQRYIDQTIPFLKECGGDVLFLGESQHFFIGPSHEQWDFVMLIKQRSLADFLAFASNPEYQSVMAHREAALIDSRLLPISAFNI